MNPSDPAMPASAALAARLLEACEDLPAWWRAPLRAGRSAAEALGRAPVDAAQWDGAWNGFREPFLIVSAHVDALRNPAPMLSAPLAGSVAAEPAERTSAFENRIPGAIGSSRVGADAGLPGRPGSSGSTRIPSRAEAMPARSRGSRAGTGGPEADPGAKSAKEILAPSLAAAGPSSSLRASLRASAPAGSGSARAADAVEAGMGAWLARAQRALRRMSSSPSERPAPGADEAKIPVPPAGPESNGAQAWFAAWIKDPSAASPAPVMAAGTAAPAAGLGTGLPGASAIAALTLAPERSIAAATARPARDPAWTAILEELMPRAVPGAHAVPSVAGGSAQTFAAAPAGPRNLKDRLGIPAEVTRELPYREGGSVPGAPVPADAPRPQGAAPMEWLDEEEDLAGKLHRLLRRQAKRRGVDLS